jgi:hypothetical protein
MNPSGRSSSSSIGPAGGVSSLCLFDKSPILTAMDALFRFPEAIERDPAIELWMQERPEELGSIARQWFEVMRSCGRDVRELMHDGCPVACVGDVAFAYVNAFRSHVNVGFHFGAELPDPAGLLEGSGKRMRHVKLKPGAAVNTTALRRLIGKAYSDIKVRI